MIKLYSTDLIELQTAAETRGRDSSDFKYAKEVEKLTEENKTLREMAERAETRARVIAANEASAFDAKYREQKRIVQGILKLLPVKRAKTLLFKLCLGDLA